MENVRKAAYGDLSRIAEIEIFNYRLNFYPIFKSDEYYFGELQVSAFAEAYGKDKSLLENTYVYDDGVVKGFIRIHGSEVKKLFTEPVLQGQGIGACLLEYATERFGVNTLWVLEKNARAIGFYRRHGFELTCDKKFEDDTDEYLVRMKTTDQNRGT